jgi:hypothetical protein
MGAPDRWWTGNTLLMVPMNAEYPNTVPEVDAGPKGVRALCSQPSRPQMHPLLSRRISNNAVRTCRRFTSLPDLTS